MPNTPRIISLSVITALIVIFGLTFFRVIAPFLLPLFLAGVMSLLCQPFYKRVIRMTNGRRRLAAGLTTGAVMVAILVPFVLGIVMLTVQVNNMISDVMDSDRWNSAVAYLESELQMDQIVNRLETLTGREIDEEEFKADLRSNARGGLKWLAERTIGLAGAAFGMLGGLVSTFVSVAMFVLALYYFLADGNGLLETAEALIPVQHNYQKELLDRFNTVVRAVVMATFAAAVVQGLVTAITVYFFGFHQFILLFLIATFCALIPLMGTGLVWLPCALWLAAGGHWVQAGVLVAIGAGVIGMLDNVVRTYLLQTDAKLHPLLGFVCVLGGIQVMGLWGVFIGPLVAAILHTLIMIFNIELQELSKEVGPHTGKEQATDEVGVNVAHPAVSEESRTDKKDGA